MTGILEGIRVVEVSMFGFVPGAGAVLADWGASVVKVETPGHGDPMRHLTIGGIAPGVGDVTYMWEIFNRGKQSLAVDLRRPEGRAIVLELVERADVFLTSLRPAARRKLGIDADAVMGRNPLIVYARGSGQGQRGPEADKGGFDSISYWFRSGAGAAITPADRPRSLNMPGPAFGDIQSGAMLAGGIGTALGRRDRSGKGLVVDLSLMSAGMWAMQPGIVGTQLTGELVLGGPPGGGNPLSQNYLTSDGRGIAFSFVDPEKYWAEFCEVVGRPEWVSDSRLASNASRRAHFDQCVALIDELIGQRTLSEWRSILATIEGQWDVVYRPGDLIHDEQARANGYLVDVEVGERRLSLVAAPVQFEETPPEMRRAPRCGEHSAAILAGLGRSPVEVAELVEAGVVGVDTS